MNKFCNLQQALQGTWGRFPTSSPAQSTAPAVNPAHLNAGPGSLYVRDTFIPSSSFTEIPHGLQVVQAANSQSGSGARIVPSVNDQPQTQVEHVINPEMKRLGVEELTGAQVLSTLSGGIEGRVVGFLDDQSAYLEKLTKSGITNSAANFSLGQSQASQSLSLYNDAVSALSSDNPTLAGNYARAFGVDPAKLRSDDRAVQQAETAKLQQAIVDHVHGTFDESEAVGSAMSRWDSAVEGFEKGRNSVVIAAGNEGEIAKMMEEESGGHRLRLPLDFETNVLENDLVTSVGATDGPGLKASYSSHSSGVDIFANGNLPSHTPDGGLVQGTSFAAPRVGVVMAELHRLNPNLSSAQVEQLMRDRLSAPGPDSTLAAPELRPEIGLDFLREQTY